MMSIGLIQLQPMGKRVLFSSEWLFGVNTKNFAYIAPHRFPIASSRGIALSLWSGLRKKSKASSAVFAALAGCDFTGSFLVEIRGMILPDRVRKWAKLFALSWLTYVVFSDLPRTASDKYG